MSENRGLLSANRRADCGTCTDQPFYLYRYFSDKYTLRDEIVDNIVQDFAEHMEVDFLHMNIEDEVHTRSCRMD